MQVPELTNSGWQRVREVGQTITPASVDRYLVWLQDLGRFQLLEHALRLTISRKKAHRARDPTTAALVVRCSCAIADVSACKAQFTAALTCFPAGTKIEEFRSIAFVCDKKSGNYEDRQCMVIWNGSAVCRFINIEQLDDIWTTGGVKIKVYASDRFSSLCLLSSVCFSSLF